MNKTYGHHNGFLSGINPGIGESPQKFIKPALT